MEEAQSSGLARINAVTSVATFASRIESQARPNETSSVRYVSFCFSSLNLSNIRMLLSTAIPTESINPAIPKC